MDNENFNIVAKKYNLNCANDFRYSDLKGIDFSDSDLRGFDFTGADLQDAKGVNIIIDNSTILDRANLANSVFELTGAVRARSENPTFLSRANNIRADATAMAAFIADHIRDKQSISDEYVIAKYLLSETNSSLNLNTGLYALRNSENSKNEFIQVVQSILAKHYDNENVIATIATLLAREKNASNIVIFLLLKMLIDPRFKVAVAACRSLMHHSLSPENINAVYSIIGSENWKPHRQQLSSSKKSKIKLVFILYKSSKPLIFLEWKPDPLKCLSKDSFKHIHAMTDQRFSYISNLLKDEKSNQKEIYRIIQNSEVSLSNKDGIRIIRSFFKACYDENGIKFEFSKDLVPTLRLSSLYSHVDESKKNKTTFMPQKFNRWLRESRLSLGSDFPEHSPEDPLNLMGISSSLNQLVNSALTKISKSR